MALNFPNNPNNGDVFTSDTKSWIYNDSKGIWISSTTGIGVIDDDTMLTASSDKLSTSESIKQYVDEHTHDEHVLAINDDDSGYEISPRGLITQWGRTVGKPFTDIATQVEIIFPIPFPNACLNIQSTAFVGPTTSTQVAVPEIYSYTNDRMILIDGDNDSTDWDVHWVAIGY